MQLGLSLLFIFAQGVGGILKGKRCIMKEDSFID
jgi:hypothetical protein